MKIFKSMVAFLPQLDNDFFVTHFNCDLAYPTVIKSRFLFLCQLT